MSLRIQVRRDEITPDLARKIAMSQSARSILQAAGTQLVSITKRAFRDSTLRQSAWAAKKDGSPSNLSNQGMLVSSIRIVSVDDRQVTVGTDRKYGAIHQFGGIIKPKHGKALVFTIGGKKIFAKQVKIPARPYFPFDRAGALVPFAVRKVGAVIESALARLLKT